MKKRIILSLVVFVIILAFITSENFAQTMPTVTVSTNKSSYKPGETGTLTIKFKTAKKVKIPVEPEIEVTLNSTDVEGLGLQPVSSQGEYLNPAQVKYKFKVSSNLTKGSSITISGSVKFGYCNEDSGICKIGTKTFSKTIKIN
ncbi:MAG: hypothetical protein N2490_05610 [Ignavibacteria bacterium]|nr:hypothetical protein [Ignavibacteria bacterium]